MMKEPYKESYPWTPEFERAVVTLACSTPSFYEAVGHAIAPGLVQTDEAQLAMRAAHSIADEAGAGPGSLPEVISWLQMPHRNVCVAPGNMRAVSEMFDVAKAHGVPDVRGFTMIVAEILRQVLLSSFDDPPGTRSERGSNPGGTMNGAGCGQGTTQSLTRSGAAPSPLKPSTPDCERCGKRKPFGMRRHARWCSPSCRELASRARRSSRPPPAPTGVDALPTRGAARSINVPLPVVNTQRLLGGSVEQVPIVGPDDRRVVHQPAPFHREQQGVQLHPP